MYAVRDGNTDVVKMLHEFGADVNHHTKVSCQYSVQLIRVISQGIVRTYMGFNNYTMLITAYMCGQIRLCQLCMCLQFGKYIFKEIVKQL